jgi:hypothetical protein
MMPNWVARFKARLVGGNAVHLCRTTTKVLALQVCFSPQTEGGEMNKEHGAILKRGGAVAGHCILTVTLYTPYSFAFQNAPVLLPRPRQRIERICGDSVPSHTQLIMLCIAR